MSVSRLATNSVETSGTLCDIKVNLDLGEDCKYVGVLNNLCASSNRVIISIIWSSLNFSMMVMRVLGLEKRQTVSLKQLQ